MSEKTSEIIKKTIKEYKEKDYNLELINNFNINLINVDINNIIDSKEYLKIYYQNVEYIIFNNGICLKAIKIRKFNPKVV